MKNNHFENSDGFEVVNTSTGSVVDWFARLHSAQERAAYLTRPDKENTLHIARAAQRVVALSY